MEDRARKEGWCIDYRAATEWQAEMARDLLLGEGIPAVVRSFLVTPYGNAMSVQMPCAGEVLVPNTCRAAAETVIADFLSSDPA
jgi:hypothetical protein